jgi:riboflavin synthase alpha subunit
MGSRNIHYQFHHYHLYNQQQQRVIQQRKEQRANEQQQQQKRQEQARQQAQASQQPLAAGDSVCIKGASSVGTIERIDGKMASVDLTRDELAQSTITAIKGLKDYRQRRVWTDARLMDLAGSAA